MKKVLTGILIDPGKRTVTRVMTDGKLKDLYRLLSFEGKDPVDTVDAVTLAGDVSHHRDTLWVDGDGFLKENNPLWKFSWVTDKDAPPFAGKGLILGTDAMGESSMPSTRAALIFSDPISIEWLDDVSAGSLGPSSEETDGEHGFVFRMGRPILKKKDGTL